MKGMMVCPLDFRDKLFIEYGERSQDIDFPFSIHKH